MTPSQYLLAGVFVDIEDELMRATAQNAPFTSAHEGYAVLLEEVDELWEHVRRKREVRDPVAMRKECIQIAAMAVRFIVDVVEGRSKR